MGIEHDQLVNKVNEQLAALCRRADFALSDFQRQKKKELEILIRRYAGGERSEVLFETMKEVTEKI